MSFAPVDGTELFYLQVGTGVPCLVTHGGLGVDHTQFREGLDPLGVGLRLVYYDHTTSPSIAPPWPRASRGARARAAPRNGLI